MNRSTFLQIAVLVFAALLIAGSVYAWGSSGGSEQDCDRSGSTNAVDSHGNEVGLGCDSCSGGDGGGGDGGSDGYSCTPSYVSCYSEENICGWKNEGQIDISCGGSCSATKPEDPKFNINGTLKSVGDSCTITDSCGNSYNGYVTCEGRCLTKNVSVTCILPGDDTPTEYNTDELNDFNSVDTEISFSELLQLKGLETWPPDNKTRAVALLAVPPIVKKDRSARLYLALIGLDYCVVKGDNGDAWDSAGLSAVKYEFVNGEKETAKNKNTNRFVVGFGSRYTPSSNLVCDEGTENKKESEDKSNSWLISQSGKNSTLLSRFISWTSFRIFGARISLATLLGYDPNNTEEQNYSCPEKNPELDPDVKVFGSVATFDSSPISTETNFIVEKCYSMDHYGKVLEYIPSRTNGDINKAKVKVAPKFNEI